MAGIRFDNTISTGTIVSLIVLLIALVGMVNRLESRITAIETKIDPLWRAYTTRVENVRADQ